MSDASYFYDIFSTSNRPINTYSSLLSKESLFEAKHAMIGAARGWHLSPPAADGAEMLRNHVKPNISGGLVLVCIEAKICKGICV